MSALPGAEATRYAGTQVVRLGDLIILRAQVTYLGNPWPAFKKRIQIPNSWVGVHSAATADGLSVRFVGIYHHHDVTIFVDFDPAQYVLRRANNSAAHVSTNDLYQAQTLGQFVRNDRNGNTLTSVRADKFANYLKHGYAADARIDVFARFNSGWLTGKRLEALQAIQEMHQAEWPDCFQAEWPGFYLEFRFDRFIRRGRHGGLVRFQKDKGSGRYDYDLVLLRDGRIDFYGDLKSSDIARKESPGNDAEDLIRCLQDYGRFWYVIYDHETERARDHGGLATIAWNEWKRSLGYRADRDFDPHSYASRFKQSVRYTSMRILELNEANFHVALSNFRQGAQRDGSARALKVMIRKDRIDNFLVYSQQI